jgi:hypothetical protein
MSTLLINYADGSFHEAQKLNLKTGLIIGRFDRAIPYGRADLDADFTARNREVLAQTLGAGCWLWKPYIVLQALKHKMVEGDLLFYCDAGAVFIASATPVLDLCRNEETPILLFSLEPEQTNRKWIKRDCFHYMEMDRSPYLDMPLIVSGYFVCRKAAFTVAFFEEWLSLAEDPRLLTDAPNSCGLPNYPQFVAHRRDQSILSLLGRRHRVPTLPDISQWGNERRPRDIPQILALTRWSA